jgi:CPA2 family monovalent cation:H+ antiporter-2
LRHLAIVALRRAGLDQAGFALGGTLAMSSTAMLTKLLAERMELDSRHGREVMGVLLFQDIAVVPLLILLPALSARRGDGDVDPRPRGLQGVFVLSLVLFFGQRLMRGGSSSSRAAARPSCSCSTCCWSRSGWPG